jgi:hypothetical protein
MTSTGSSSSSVAPTIRPTVFPAEFLQLVDQVLAGKRRRCEKAFLLAAIDFLSGCRTEFGEAADWVSLEAAIKLCGLSIDQVLNCASRMPDGDRPAGRTFRVFAFDSDFWKSFREDAAHRDLSDTGCWRALCQSAGQAARTKGDVPELVSFVRDAVRITALPIDFVLDSLSAPAGPDNDQPRSPLRTFDRFWLDRKTWERTQGARATLSPETGFLYASAWGYGRVPGMDCPDAQGKDEGRLATTIKAFRADPLRQIGHLADRLDYWLDLTKGDEKQAYAALRAGSAEAVDIYFRTGADAVLGSLAAITSGLGLAASDIEPQVIRLENGLRCLLSSWSVRDLERELAVLATLDGILGDGRDAEYNRGRLDQLLAQYAQQYRDLRDNVRTGMIDLTELQAENLGQLSLDEVDACLHRIELRNTDFAGLAERVNLRSYREQLNADRALMQSLYARLDHEESVDEAELLRQRLLNLNLDQERRERLVNALLD